MKFRIALAIVVLAATFAPSGVARSQPGVDFADLTAGLQLNTSHIEGSRAVRCLLGGKAVIFWIDPYFAAGETYARVLLYRLQGRSPFAALTFTRDGRLEHVYVDENGEGKITREVPLLVFGPGSIGPNPELIDPKNPKKGIDRCRILATAYETRPLP